MDVSGQSLIGSKTTFEMFLETLMPPTQCKTCINLTFGDDELY